VDDPHHAEYVELAKQRGWRTGILIARKPEFVYLAPSLFSNPRRSCAQASTSQQQKLALEAPAK